MLIRYHRNFTGIIGDREYCAPAFRRALDMINTSSENYRSKAIVAEKRAREAGNYDFKCSWQEIAIEWHALAHRAAQQSDKHKSESN
jgi:hypothetical protein